MRFSCLRAQRAVHPEEALPQGKTFSRPTRRVKLAKKLAGAEQRVADLELELSSLRQFSEASAVIIAAATAEAQAAVKEAKAEKRKAAAPSREKSDDTSWSTAMWCDDLKPICHVIARALMRPIGELTSDGAPDEAAELSFVRALGRQPSEIGVEAVLRLLREGPFLAQLSIELHGAAVNLAEQSAATASELQGKFMEEAAFTLAYGGMDTFFGGLERLLGPPSPNLLDAMQREHCASADSKEYFTSANYGVTTTSQVEWFFVVDPQVGLGRCGLRSWPSEQTLLEAADAWAERRAQRQRARRPELERDASTRSNVSDAAGEAAAGEAAAGEAAGSAKDLVDDLGDDPSLRMREPQSLAYFESMWAQIDEKLEELGMDCLQKAEFLAARLCAPAGRPRAQSKAIF